MLRILLTESTSSTVSRERVTLAVYRYSSTNLSPIEEQPWSTKLLIGLALGVTSLSSGEDEGVPLLPWSPLLPSLLITLWEEKRDLKYWEQDASTALWQWNCCPCAVRVTSQNSCFLHKRLSPCSRVSLCVGSKVDVLSPDLDMTSRLWTPPRQQINHASHLPQVIYLHNTRSLYRCYPSTSAIENNFWSKLLNTSRVHPAEDNHHAIPAGDDLHPIRLQSLSTLSSGRTATNRIAVVPTTCRSYSFFAGERDDLNGGSRFLMGAVKTKWGYGDAAALIHRGSAAEVAGWGKATAATVDGEHAAFSQYFYPSPILLHTPHNEDITPRTDLRNHTKAISWSLSRQRLHSAFRFCFFFLKTRTWVSKKIFPEMQLLAKLDLTCTPIVSQAPQKRFLCA